MSDQPAQEDIFARSFLRRKLDQAGQNTRHLHHGQMAEWLPGKSHLQPNDHVQ